MDKTPNTRLFGGRNKSATPNKTPKKKVKGQKLEYKDAAVIQTVLEDDAVRYIQSCILDTPLDCMWGYGATVPTIREDITMWVLNNYQRRDDAGVVFDAVMDGVILQNGVPTCGIHCRVTTTESRFTFVATRLSPTEGPLYKQALRVNKILQVEV